MKATETRLLDFLENSPQFVIPVYQRTYSWTERECRQLWDDVLRTGSDDQVTTHFIGSVVYIGEGPHRVTRRPPLLVIDGQQRLTTAMLMLEALARRVGDEEPVDGFSARKIRNYYLLNELEENDRRFKLLLTQTDKASLVSLVAQQPPPAEQSRRILRNFEFFDKQIGSLDGHIEPLCRGLEKLMIVDIALSRDQDNPQLIFESMNSTGRELSQADLIRNFVWMGLPPPEQTQLYERHWRPMEVAFGQEAYGTDFDGFVRHYLTLKTGQIPKLAGVYEAFKSYARRSQIAQQGISELVADVHRFAGYYCSMALDQEPAGILSEAFRDLRELKVDVAYPLLLELYNDFRVGALSGDDFCKAVRLIEAYVFRRAVCSIPTNSLNATFATFARDLDKDRYLESIKARFLLLPEYRRFPRDEEFKRELQSRDVYNFRSCSYLLRRLENHGRKEPVPVDEYTIEHILPQNPDVPTQWQNDLGPEWQRVHEARLHTLGNLTLTGYNSEYSDRSFGEKRDMEGGFKMSPLRLNEGLGTRERWDEPAIMARARDLAEIAAQVWEDVDLSPEQLAPYRARPERGAPNTYTIEDHPQLAPDSVTRSLFDVFRAEVLALSPVVTEEYLKQYVAYKAETNFVDVVPQASRLRLSLNMHFHELHDPRHLAKDVTNVGRWGNGDVEVHFSDVAQLPNVMALVRQALEKQMGDGES